ncbi:MAG: hypothetical protein V5A64_04225 [Candidatus Thermoplasmatota archaeon]
MDENEELSYRVLRKIQRKEKKSPVLIKIPPSFYEELKEYLKKLDERLEKESGSKKQMLLREEVDNNKKIAMNIYEQREKKILLAAISKARGGQPEIRNMLEEEKKLFDQIIKLLMNSRETFLKPKTEEKRKDEIEEEETESKAAEEKKNSVVRVKNDVPSFVGTDEKKYFLKQDDLISLPDDLAEMLENKNMVEKIEIVA